MNFPRETQTTVEETTVQCIEYVVQSTVRRCSVYMQSQCQIMLALTVALSPVARNMTSAADADYDVCESAVRLTLPPEAALVDSGIEKYAVSGEQIIIIFSKPTFINYQIQIQIITK